MKSSIAVVVALSILSLSAAPPAWADNTSNANDVFLSLTRDAIPLSDAPTNTQVITSADFEKTSALTVGDVIADQPGMVIQSYGSEGFLQSPAIRGFTAQQLLLVIDDVPQTPDSTGSFDLSRIPLDNVDRIEIIRGGASAVYGPNAEGGVIHIITKKPTAAVDVEETSEAGSYGTYNNQFHAGTSQGPVQAEITGSRDWSNGFQQNANYENTDLTGYFAYDAKKWGKLSYNVEGEKGNVGLPSGTPAPFSEWNGTVERQANDLTAQSTQTNGNNRLQYTNQFGPVNVTARLANNVEQLDTYGAGSPAYGTESDIRTEGRNAFGSLEIPNVGAAGFEYYERRLDSAFYDGHYLDDAWGTYYEAYFIHTDWLKLTPGVRYDKDYTYGDSWSPRVELLIKPSDLWKVSASANRAFQAPTFADLYDPYVPLQYQPTSLQPEITWSYNIGASVQPIQNLEASLTLFHTDTKDEIALNANEDYAAYNINRAYTNGGEAEISYRYQIVNQTLSYTYLQAMGQNGQNGDSSYSALALTPKNKIDYRADVQLPWQAGATFDVLYLDRQWTGPAETDLEIPGYTVVNVKLTKKIGWAELFVSINNLFDRHYAEAADYGGIPYGTPNYYPQPGRNYMGGMTVRFLK